MACVGDSTFANSQRQSNNVRFVGDVLEFEQVPALGPHFLLRVATVLDHFCDPARDVLNAHFVTRVFEHENKVEQSIAVDFIRQFVAVVPQRRVEAGLQQHVEDSVEVFEKRDFQLAILKVSLA